MAAARRRPARGAGVGAVHTARAPPCVRALSLSFPPPLPHTCTHAHTALFLFLSPSLPLPVCLSASLPLCCLCLSASLPLCLSAAYGHSHKPSQTLSRSFAPDRLPRRLTTRLTPRGEHRWRAWPPHRGRRSRRHRQTLPGRQCETPLPLSRAPTHLTRTHSRTHARTHDARTQSHTRSPARHALV